MPQISIDTGWVNLRASSAKVNIFHCPLRNAGAAALERILFAAAKDAATEEVTAISGWNNPRPAVVTTVNGRQIPKDMKAFGSMTAASYEITNGQVLKVFASLKSGWQTVGQVSAATPIGVVAQQYFRVREGAAIVTIKIKMVDDRDCPTKFATITGPIERLTLQEAIALGVNPPKPEYRAAYKGSLFDFLTASTTVIQPAANSAQVVTTPQGTTQTVVTTVRRRAIRTN